MKKTVITFGLIAGAIMALMMLLTMPFQDRIGFDKGAIIGYTTMVLSGLMIFFGVKSYRDNEAGGKISFGKAFQVGFLIALISAVCYVDTWQFIYFKLMPDFWDKYSAYAIEKARLSGATPESVQANIDQMKKLKEYFDNPIYNAAITLIEPLPVGLLMTLLSAAILRRPVKSLDSKL